MKKILITLTVLAALTLTACGNDSEVTVTSTTTAVTTTEAVVTTVPDTDEGTATEIITTEQEEVTTTTPAEVEDITTTTVTDEVTTEITTIPEEVTTEATTTTEAAPAWVDEPMDNTTMYATTACYVRKDAVVGSDALYVVTAGKAVTIVGKTDTGYFKLSDGGYIHSDYLSTQKPVEEVVTTTAPVQTEEPTTTTEAPAPAYNLPEYNLLTGATYRSVPIVITKEDIKAINDEIFRLTNELRVSLGLNKLQQHATLTSISRIRANELIYNYSHTRPNGEPCHSVCKELGFGEGMGENIGALPLNYHSMSIVDGVYKLNVDYIVNYFIDGWKNSSGHYANMTKTSYKYFAVDSDFGLADVNNQTAGFTAGRNYIYIVQNFKS